MSLTFDEEKHQYSWDGKEVPGVSKILESVGLKKEFMGDPWYGERGSAVHLATRFLDENRLDESTLDPEIKPYIEGYKKFLADTEFKSIAIETPLYSPLHEFAGTPDRIGILFGKTCVIDIKTSKQYAKDMEFQLWAYSVLWNESNPSNPILGRFLVFLREDETYELFDIGDRSEYRWTEILHVYSLKTEKTRKPKKIEMEAKNVQVA